MRLVADDQVRFGSMLEPAYQRHDGRDHDGRARQSARAAGQDGVRDGELPQGLADLIQKLSKKPTPAQASKVTKLLAAAHPEILKLCKPCGVYVIWSSS